VAGESVRLSATKEHDEHFSSSPNATKTKKKKEHFIFWFIKTLKGGGRKN
jgi:hypothetical protein